jgi:cell division septation protein DedD
MYAVQFAAFKVKENAEKLAAKLKAGGVAVEMASIDHSKNGLLHLVRIPPTTSREEAQKNFEQYNGKLDLKAQVVTISGH